MFNDTKTKEDRIPNEHKYYKSLLPNYEIPSVERVLLWMATIIVTVLILALLAIQIQTLLQSHARTQQQARLPFTRQFETPGFEIKEITRR